MTEASKKVVDVKELVIVFLLSLVIFGPITGIVLNGYDFTLHPWRPFTLAGIVVVGRLLLSLVSHRIKLPTVNEVPAGLDKFIIFLCLGALATIPFFASKYWLTVVILALIYVLLGLGLNIVVGLAGLLDLGYVAFYAVGAYTLALGFEYLGIGFWGALPLAAILAMLCGIILGFPVLRMHGDYLAIVTLGFGEIIRLVLTNWLEFTGGPNGVRAPKPTFLGLEFTRSPKFGGTPIHEFLGVDYSNHYLYLFIYIVLAIVVLFTIGAVGRLQRMPAGRAWEALREDEIACRSLGLNHVSVKLSAFAIGATIGGVAGVFFAAYQGFVNPTSFTFFESALILAVVVLGGMGSTRGVIAAAVILTVLPEVLRDFAGYRVLMFGLLMVLMMIWRPRGLIHAKRPLFSRPQGAAHG